MFVTLTISFQNRLQKNTIFLHIYCNLFQYNTVKEEMSSTKDQQYIDKVIKGDTNAFSYLIDNYKDMVFSLAYKITKNREDAEEISQDTFIKVFKNLKKFKGDSKFSTWLYRIAYHTSLDTYKKNKKEKNTYQINEISFNKIQEVESILEGIERKERTKIMDSCLLKLPEEERSLLWMFYYDELSLKEIIEVTDLSEANLKVKLHRARKKMLGIVEQNVAPELIENYEKN